MELSLDAMVIVTHVDGSLNDNNSKMQSACAMGPRHNLFGGGIVAMEEHWHKMEQEPATVKREEGSSPVSQGSGSPYSSGSNELQTSFYATPFSAGDEMVPKEELNNNNNNSASPIPPTLVPCSPANPLRIPTPKRERKASPKLAKSQHSDDSQSSSSSMDSSRPGPSRNCYIDNSPDDSLRHLQLAMQRMDTPSRRRLSSPGCSSSSNEKPLQCPVCTFSSTSRVNFNAHLQSHEDQRACSMCDYFAESGEMFRKHMLEAHDVYIPPGAIDDFDEEEPGLNVPKINSQGKVKTFRCKQCNFLAVTKLDYWEHSKIHIKTDKRLTCPRCPFITEYKHHLEYHLRNHFKSKPFKCSKCKYTCVNKSMLNSHMKSHSNVYQFRCADCNYATKYCHSLKLHLRKYDHKPAMVLNPDGTPNPFPVIDIYGTRRGPKSKNGRTSFLEELPQQQQQQLQQQEQQQQQQQFQQQQQQEAQEAQQQQQQQHEQQQQQANLAALHPLFASPYGLPYYNHLLHPLMYPGKPIMQHDKPAQYFFNNNNSIGMMNNNVHQGEENEDSKHLLSIQLANGMEQPTLMVRSEESLRAPLGLSRSDTQCGSGSSGSPSPPTVGRTARRKGKAYKLERLRQHHSSDEEEMEVDRPVLKKQDVKAEDVGADELPLKCVLVEGNPRSPDNNGAAVVNNNNNNTEVVNHNRSNVDTPPNNLNSRPAPESYNCNYCDIIFKDVIMYTMHMGYHGYQDPYTCNMCGETTPDRVSFFLHIARTPHS